MTATIVRDVMQVCRSGHVITVRLRSHPEQACSRCDRCGAPTFSRCPTCAKDLPGGLPVPGLLPIGELRAPEHCPSCGSPFPWCRQAPSPTRAASLDVLEPLLRRVPHMARQLRDRQQSRPTLHVQDVLDLQDLVRAVLALHFDNVYPECRTPAYAAGTRIDYLLEPAQVAVCCKLTCAGLTEKDLLAQLTEDGAYYERRGSCAALVCYVHDPGQFLPKPTQFEASAQRICGETEVRCVIGV
jgi:hypothetical protein